MGFIAPQCALHEVDSSFQKLSPPLLCLTPSFLGSPPTSPSSFTGFPPLSTPKIVVLLIYSIRSNSGVPFPMKVSPVLLPSSLDKRSWSFLLFLTPLQPVHQALIHCVAIIFVSASLLIIALPRIRTMSSLSEFPCKAQCLIHSWQPVIVCLVTCNRFGRCSCFSCCSYYWKHRDVKGRAQSLWYLVTGQNGP